MHKDLSPQHKAQHNNLADSEISRRSLFKLAALGAAASLTGCGAEADRIQKSGLKLFKGKCIILPEFEGNYNPQLSVLRVKCLEPGEYQVRQRGSSKGPDPIRRQWNFKIESEGQIVRLKNPSQTYIGSSTIEVTRHLENKRLETNFKSFVEWPQQIKYIL